MQFAWFNFQFAALMTSDLPKQRRFPLREAQPPRIADRNANGIGQLCDEARPNLRVPRSALRSAPFVTSV